MARKFQSVTRTPSAGILQEGRQIYEQGLVTNLEREAQGVWHAQVQSDPPEDVRIWIRPEGVEWECSCKRRRGGPCAHLVAVVDAVNALEEARQEEGAQQPSPPARMVTLEQILRDVPREHLISELLAAVQYNPGLSDTLLLWLCPNPDQRFCETLVNALLNETFGSEPEYPYAEQMAVVRIENVVQTAARWLVAGRSRDALTLVQAVINVVGNLVIFDGYDPEWELTKQVEQATRAMSLMAPSMEKGELRKLFDYCLSRGAKAATLDADWGWDLLRLASQAARRGTERLRLTQALNSLPKEIADPELRTAVIHGSKAIHMQMLQDHQGAEAARAYALDNLDVPSIRMGLLREYLHSDDYQGLQRACLRALELSDLDEEERAYVNTYLSIATSHTSDRQGRITSLRNRLLYWDSPWATEQLKAEVGEAEWPAYLDGLVAEFRQTEPGREALARILADEGRWDDLLQVALLGSRQAVMNYGDELEARYPQEMPDAYERVARAILRTTANRLRYAEAARYVGRIKALGQPERADRLVDELCATYDNRPAMIEELQRVKRS
jgi:hypothetical protein